MTIQRDLSCPWLTQLMSFRDEPTVYIELTSMSRYSRRTESIRSHGLEFLHDNQILQRSEQSQTATQSKG